MKQPSRFVRIAGSPVMAWALTMCGVCLIIAWANGRASFLTALFGWFAIGKAISSVRRMNIYNAWLKEWNAVGTFGRQPAKPKKRISKTLTRLVAWLFFGMTAYSPWAAGDPQVWHVLFWTWIACALFLLARLVMRISTLITNRRKGKGGVVPVSWMLSATVDSPSRRVAEKRLPEYAARVLTPGAGRGRDRDGERRTYIQAVS
jgi:hypothetical protein